MNFSHSGDPLSSKTPGTLVFFVDKEDKIISSADSHDEALVQAVNSVLDSEQLKKSNSSSAQCPIVSAETDSTAASLILVRCKNSELSAEEFRGLAGSVAKTLLASNLKDIHLDISGLKIKGQNTSDAAQFFTTQMVKASYRFDQFKSKKKPALKAENVIFHIGEGELDSALETGKAIGEGANFTRDLGNRPANFCTPTHLADDAIALADGSETLTATIHDEAEMQKLGMGSFLSVTAGSDQPAKLIELNYQNSGKGGDKNAAPYVLIGKGVTFDTGGISMKPPGAMDEMKFDMCGAATVLGVVKAVELLQLPINLVGLVAAAENMPGGDATKPGDVVTSMAGKTIEVLNTDAEGRLVLCDTLTYAQKFEPKLMIDIATLTGACIVALGAHASGLYSNDDKLAESLLEAGQTTGDRAWRMPLWKEYTKQLESNFADLANIGGPKAGSVTAACFLKEFVGNTPWAHLDIAGTAWLQGSRKGATGRPVELLMEFLLRQSKGSK
jgi:leucyl aminopeptidase